MMKLNGKYLLQLTIVFAAYLITGICGLKLDAVSGYASYVWPPTGIALSALLLGGFGFWPAIAAAAFFVNYNTGAAPVTCLGIAAGNTLEAVAAAAMLQRAGFRPQLSRIRDVAYLFVYGALISTLISASIGVASLWAASTKSLEGLFSTWSAWWIGDVLGDLVVVPLILVAFRARPSRLSAVKTIEFVFLATALISALALLFGDGDPKVGTAIRPFPFILFPLVVWAAMRFGQPGNVIVNLVISVTAVWGTAKGLGPLIQPTLRESLFSLVSFMVIFSVTGNLLAAAIEEIKSNLAEKAFLFQKAQGSIQMRDEFLSIASHELKTPLTSLNLQIDMLKQKLGNNPSIGSQISKTNQAFELLARQTRRLTNLVDDLLDTSHINTGQFNFDLRPADLSSIVKDTANRYSDQLAQAQCTLNLHIEEPVAGKFDILRIGQLIENLLSNAAKYAPKSSVDVTLKRENHSAVLIVSDNGPGIPREKQARLFERFERANSDRGVTGLGLGLFIVSEIAKGHHGTVSIDSDTGRGTRFIVDLPLAPAV